jgi:hypothetical protein
MTADRGPSRGGPEEDEQPSRSGRSLGRWIGTLVGGVVAVMGGAGGCLVFLVILLAPLLIFVVIFGPGLLSIFE